jgi:hypothetical protein
VIFDRSRKQSQEDRENGSSSKKGSKEEGGKEEGGTKEESGEEEGGAKEESRKEEGHAKEESRKEEGHAAIEAVTLLPFRRRMPQPRIRDCGIGPFTTLIPGAYPSALASCVMFLVIAGLLAGSEFAAAAMPGPGPSSNIRSREVWLSSGLRYNRNLSIDPDRIEDSSSPVAITSLIGSDQRVFLGWELRSLGWADYEVDLEDSDRDFQNVSVQTGPVLHLGESWDFYGSVGGGFSFFGYDFYSGFGATYLRLENLEGAFLRVVELDVGYERNGDSFDVGDAPWIDLYTTLGHDSLVLEADWIELTPLLSFYLSDEDDFAYGQLGATLEYGFPTVGNLEIRTSFMGYRRVYDLANDGAFPRQRDWFLLAQLDILYSGLFVESLAVEVTGSYERNWSNYGDQEWEGGSVSLIAHWRF